MPTELVWKGPIVDFLRDTTPEIDLEGSLNCGKTWACLWKELEAVKTHPGMWSFIFRYSDDSTRTKLKPALEQMLLMRGEDIPRFDSKELYYDFPNGSRIYAFGLKSVDYVSRYSKLRGLGVSRIYCDQAEELPGDIGLELRARLRQPGYPHQLTFSPNPPNYNHWLADRKRGGFPEDNSFKGRHYYSISLYDNAHNLPAETITQLEAAYPTEHAKHKSVVLGQRGVNVMGDPVYGDTFVRRLHVRHVITRPQSPILEAFQIGKAAPCYVAAQRFYTGGWAFLGGILGLGMFLEDFFPLVKERRREWFPDASEFKTCCAPSSEAKTANSAARYTELNLLREADFQPRSQDHANSPDVVLTMIERLAGYMRRRSIGGEEAFAISDNPQRWLRMSREGLEPCAFLDEAFEAGYVWNAEPVSVGNKSIRCPNEDGWFEQGMHCCEHLELNFGAHHLTDEQRAAHGHRVKWLNYGNGSMSWTG